MPVTADNVMVKVAATAGTKHYSREPVKALDEGCEKFGYNSATKACELYKSGCNLVAKAGFTTYGLEAGVAPDTTDGKCTHNEIFNRFSSIRSECSAKSDAQTCTGSYEDQRVTKGTDKQCQEDVAGAWRDSNAMKMTMDSLDACTM